MKAIEKEISDVDRKADVRPAPDVDAITSLIHDEE
jgi:hypothetical protein